MKTLIDMHTHTGFSPDGEGTVEQSLAKAKELGLAAFAITDHCDCNFRYKAEMREKSTSGSTATSYCFR